MVGVRPNSNKAIGLNVGRAWQLMVCVKANSNKAIDSHAGRAWEDMQRSLKTMQQVTMHIINGHAASDHASCVRYLGPCDHERVLYCCTVLG